MAYDDDLAERVRVLVREQSPGPVEERRMFGALAFMVGGHLAVAVNAEGLLMRTDPAETETLLARPHVDPMQMGGQISTTWIRVGLPALLDDADLAEWVTFGVTGVADLPPT